MTNNFYGLDILCGSFGRAADRPNLLMVRFLTGAPTFSFVQLLGTISHTFLYSKDLHTRIKILSLFATLFFLGYKVKMFYVWKTISNGRIVASGDSIGTMTDRASVDPGMTNHVHVQLYKDEAIVNPTSFVNC